MFGFIRPEYDIDFIVVTKIFSLKRHSLGRKTVPKLAIILGNTTKPRFLFPAAI